MWVSECYFKEPLCGKKNDLVAPMSRNAHIKLEPRVLHITHSSLWNIVSIAHYIPSRGGGGGVKI